MSAREASVEEEMLKNISYSTSHSINVNILGYHLILINILPKRLDDAY